MEEIYSQEELNKLYEDVKGYVYALIRHVFECKVDNLESLKQFLSDYIFGDHPYDYFISWLNDQGMEKFLAIQNWKKDLDKIAEDLDYLEYRQYLLDEGIHSFNRTIMVTEIAELFSSVQSYWEKEGRL